MPNGLEIQLSDITELDVNCVVNAANSSLQQGCGVCGAIFAKAGAERLQRACNLYGFCPTGSAVLTPGFQLRAQWIIHAVGPRWEGGKQDEEKKLAACYKTALDLAVEKGCHSIAFPLISAGIYGYPAKEAWEVAIRSVTEFLNVHTAANLQVIFAVIDKDMEALGNSVLEEFRKDPPAPKHIPVSDMVPNITVDGFYVLQSASLRTTASGKTFLSANVNDRSGSIPVIFWDYAGPLSSSDDGKVVGVKGRVSEFKGSLQITLESLRLREESDEIDLSELIPVAPIDVEATYQKILGIVDTIQDSDYKQICEEFLRRHSEKFRSIPAAKSVHHSFLHGLLMHTGYMLETADFLANLYHEVIDRDLLLTGTLLHDFAKREEFTFSALGLVTDYSTKGQLLGHLVMGAQEAAEIAKELNVPEQKSILLQHMLLAHHGKPEYGAAVIPMCAESELLSMIDMTDSRMEIYRENLEQTPMGEFSGRIFALDGHRAYRHYQPND